MSALMQAHGSIEDRLADLAAEVRDDPLRFVLAAFPWGEPGGPLADLDGPRPWQREMLASIGRRLKAGVSPILQAVASGHGPGKSALVAWLTLWAVTTMPDARALVTANTGAQLTGKTSPELAKWARLSIFRAWFKVSASAIVSADTEHERTWRADLVTWSIDNLEAFSGLYNSGRRILLAFDEASGIDDGVWTVSEGVLTDASTQIVWLVCGNPTRPDGRFFECFNRQRDRWHGITIDSRSVPGTNLELFDEWATLYGEDSDFFRVRVRGLFPRTGSMQFIGPDLVEQACTREPLSTLSDPLILGVDVARFGDDASVIAFRKGRDARTIPWHRFRGLDTMQLAGRVAELAAEYRPDAIFVDEGGVGGGVVDRCRQLGLTVIGVQFGAKSDRLGMEGDKATAVNKRTEMWANMRTWLAHGAIPDDLDLQNDLVGPQYSFVIKEGRDALALEPKSSMKARGLASPDAADALALTFAHPVAPRFRTAGRWPSTQELVTTEYNPFVEDPPTAVRPRGVPGAPHDALHVMLASSKPGEGVPVWPGGPIAGNGNGRAWEWK